MSIKGTRQSSTSVGTVFHMFSLSDDIGSIGSLEGGRKKRKNPLLPFY